MDRRTFLRGTTAFTLAAGLPAAGGAVLQGSGRTFTPEMFGAKGDGVTNDTRALAAMAAAVNAAGGGIVEFRRRATYVIGEQFPSFAPGSTWSFTPGKVMEFAGCTRPLIIRGNGARIKCADNLRYGTFDARTGRATSNKLPFYHREAASPYSMMIRVERCAGPVEIAELELDGNLPRLRIGGEYGDTGRQIPAIGIGLVNNSGSEVIRDVYSHHHPMDGLLIDGIDARTAGVADRRIVRLRSEYNGRQGCSIVGGRGYKFEDCKFNHTGRSVLTSAPSAGVDIEAEDGKHNRDFTFTRCEFSNNSGVGMLADSGPSERARFDECSFIGTTSWSAWPKKPLFRFYNCTFVGAVVNPHGDPDPNKAAQFHDCVFRDDPKLTPTGKVYLGGQRNGTIADVSSNRNVLFNRCHFKLTHGGLLPWSWFAIYSDCRMEQTAAQEAYPKGKYLGTNLLTGNVDLYGTTVIGTLVANGKRMQGKR